MKKMYLAANHDDTNPRSWLVNRHRTKGFWPLAALLAGRLAVFHAFMKVLSS
jgi:hypothetical protein